MLEIKLDWPDTRLMPNRKNGKHWAATHVAIAQARDGAYRAARHAMAGKVFAIDGRTPMRVTFVAPDRRSRDLDNLLAACKPHVDGIAQALGIDDKYFRPITVDDGFDQFRRGYVLVEIG